MPTFCPYQVFYFLCTQVSLYFSSSVSINFILLSQPSQLPILVHAIWYVILTAAYILPSPQSPDISTCPPFLISCHLQHLASSPIFFSPHPSNAPKLSVSLPPSSNWPVPFTSTMFLSFLLSSPTFCCPADNYSVSVCLLLSSSSTFSSSAFFSSDLP